MDGYLTINNNILTVNSFYQNKVIDTQSQIISNNNSTDSLTLRNSIDFIKYTDRFNNEQLIFYPIFTINLNLTTCQLVIHKTKQKFRLIFLGKNINKNDYSEDTNINKIYIVKFKMDIESRKIFDYTCNLINKCIILSEGYKQNLFSINLRNNFCQEYFINNHEFLTMAKTGDILLFKGDTRESKCQRLITKAAYDHVALIITDETGVNIYESTGEDGVKSRPWSEFFLYHWILSYVKMTYRPLIVDIGKMKSYIIENEDKNDESVINFIKNKNIVNNISKLQLQKMFNDCLNKNMFLFVENTENKKYTFKKSGYFCDSTMRNDVEKRKAYSCSELIAACYYFCGIINEKHDADTYLPGNFSRDGIVSFVEGFSLGNEYIIDFSS